MISGCQRCPAMPVATAGRARFCWLLKIGGPFWERTPAVIAEKLVSFLIVLLFLDSFSFFPFAVSGRKSLQTLFLYSSIHTFFVETSPWVTVIAISGNNWKKNRFCTVRDVPLVRGRKREREREREREKERERERERERESGREGEREGEILSAWVVELKISALFILWSLFALRHGMEYPKFIGCHFGLPS